MLRFLTQCKIRNVHNLERCQINSTLFSVFLSCSSQCTGCSHRLTLASCHWLVTARNVSSVLRTHQHALFKPNNLPVVEQSNEKPRILQQFIYSSLRTFDRFFSSSDDESKTKFDLKDDIETKTILKEIMSDFEPVKESLKDDNICDDDFDDDILNEIHRARHDTGSHQKGEEETSHNEKLEENNQKFGQLQMEKLNEHENIQPPFVKSISLERGKTGVFDLDDLVSLLEKEDARNICVIEVPKEARFVDHMVIGSALSLRHLRAMSSHIVWIHKKRMGKGDSFLKVEGYDTDWHAMDLGNIILHLFMPETRAHYDLETLWTNWGKTPPEEDETDPYALSPEDAFWQSLEPPSSDGVNNDANTKNK